MPQLLGIDYGTKQLGLALGSTESRLARPWRIIPYSQHIAQDLAQLIQAEAVALVVVGLPRNLEGEETAQSAQVRAFAAQLQAVITQPVILQDETLTSVAAAERLGKSRVSSDSLDSMAAAILLQDYLDTLKS